MSVALEARPVSSPPALWETLPLPKARPVTVPGRVRRDEVRQWKNRGKRRERTTPEGKLLELIREAWDIEPIPVVVGPKEKQSLPSVDFATVYGKRATLIAGRITDGLSIQGKGTHHADMACAVVGSLSGTISMGGNASVTALNVAEGTRITVTNEENSFRYADREGSFSESLLAPGTYRFEGGRPVVDVASADGVVASGGVSVSPGQDLEPPSYAEDFLAMLLGDSDYHKPISDEAWRVYAGEVWRACEGTPNPKIEVAPEGGLQWTTPEVSNKDLERIREALRPDDETDTDGVVDRSDADETPRRRSRWERFQDWRYAEDDEPEVSFEELFDANSVPDEPPPRRPSRLGAWWRRVWDDSEIYSIPPVPEHFEDDPLSQLHAADARRKKEIEEALIS